MSELNQECQPTASQVERLVRPELSNEWNASIAGEPSPSRRWRCRLTSGEEIVCSRYSIAGEPSWIHGSYVQGGITHWKEFI